MTKSTTKAAAPAASVTEAVKFELPAPKTNRGQGSIYKFDSLTEVGQSFGVKGKTLKQVSSAISAANRKGKAAVEDKDGNPTYETKAMPSGPNGELTQVPDTSKPITKVVRKFRAVEVDADLKKQIKGTPLEGSDVIVGRII